MYKFALKQQTTVKMKRTVLCFLCSLLALIAQGQIDGNIGCGTAGALVGRYGSVERARQALSQGVYLMKNGEKTIKIAVK